MHGKTLVLGIEAGAARHRPALENATQLQTKIIVKSGRRVLLDQIGMTGYFMGLLAGGLARLGKVALRAIGREFGGRGAGSGHLTLDNCVRPLTAPRRPSSSSRGRRFVSRVIVAKFVLPLMSMGCAPPWVEVSNVKPPWRYQRASPPKARPTNDCGTAEFKFKRHGEKVRASVEDTRPCSFLSAIHETRQ